MLIIALVIALAAAVGIAFYKHHTASAVEASAVKEAAIVKAAVVAEADKLLVIGSKTEEAVKTELAKVVTALKSL